MAPASSATVWCQGRSSALTTESVAAEDTSAVERRTPRALPIIGAIVALAAVVALGVYLAYDPFEDLPSDESVMVNLAGVFPAEGEEPLEEPRGIAIGGGKVYVAEAGAGRVSVFSRYGERDGEILLTPAEGTDKTTPTALVLAGGGRLAVVDVSASRVMVFSAADRGEAQPLFEIAVTDDAGSPGQPGALVFADGVLYVTEALSRSVLTYDAEDGTPLGSIGGDLEPSLRYPGGVALLEDGLAVSSTNDARVVVLDVESGAEKRTIESDFLFPRALVRIDNDGLAVVDAMAHAVLVFDSSGSRTHLIDGGSVPEVTLRDPAGMAWDRVRGRLYATDGAQGRVLVFNVRL